MVPPAVDTKGIDLELKEEVINLPIEFDEEVSRVSQGIQVLGRRGKAIMANRGQVSVHEGVRTDIIIF